MSQTFIAKADLQALSVDQFLDMDLDAVQLLAPKKVLPTGVYLFTAGTADVIEMGENKLTGIAFNFKLTGLVELEDSKAALPEDIEWPVEAPVKCQLQDDRDGNGKRRLKTITEQYAARLNLKTASERIAVFEGMTGQLRLKVDTYARGKEEIEFNTVDIFSIIYN